MRRGVRPCSTAPADGILLTAEGRMPLLGWVGKLGRAALPVAAVTLIALAAGGCYSDDYGYGHHGGHYGHHGHHGHWRHHDGHHRHHHGHHNGHGHGHHGHHGHGRW